MTNKQHIAALEKDNKTLHQEVKMLLNLYHDLKEKVSTNSASLKNQQDEIAEYIKKRLAQ